MKGSVLQLPPQCIHRSSQSNSAQRICWRQHTQLVCNQQLQHACHCLCKLDQAAIIAASTAN